MAKLTDLQLVTLSRASQRPDGLIVIPETLKGAAAAQLAASLLRRGLVAEVPAPTGAPFHKAGETGQPLALVLTHAGYTALGIDADGEPVVDGTRQAAGSSASHDRTLAVSAVQGRREKPGRTGAGPSRQELVLSLLRRSDGVSLAELSAATGWLPHSARAFLTGLRKQGHVIGREARSHEPGSGLEKVYRLLGSTAGEEG